MADEKGGPVGDRVWGIHPRYKQTLLIQCGGQGGTDEKISLDGTDGTQRGRSAEERQVPKEEEIMADQTTEGTAIDKGRGGIFNTQRGGGQDASANKGTCVLDIPVDLASSRQTDGTTEYREGQRNRGKKAETRVPTSTADGQTGESPGSGSIH